MFGRKSKVLLIGLGVLTVFDVLVELPFLKANLSDTTVFWLTLLVYFAIAYESARLGGIKQALLCVLVVCVYDWLVTPGIEWLFKTLTMPFSVSDWALGLAFIYLPCSVATGLLAAVIVRLSLKKTE